MAQALSQPPYLPNTHREPLPGRVLSNLAGAAERQMIID